MHEFLCDPANRFNVSLNTRVDCSTRETFPRKQREWVLSGLIHFCLNFNSACVLFLSSDSQHRFQRQDGALRVEQSITAKNLPQIQFPLFFQISLLFVIRNIQIVCARKKKKMKRILGESKSYNKHQQCIENMVDWDLDCEPFPR